MKNRLKFTFSVLLIFVTVFTSNAQVAINTTGNSPHVSAMLDVESNSKGLLIPRMTTDQINTLGATAA